MITAQSDLFALSVFGRARPRAAEASAEAGAEMQGLIDRLDKDGDGKVNHTELTLAFIKHKPPAVADLTQAIANVLVSLDGPAVSAKDLSAGIARMASGATQRAPQARDMPPTPEEKATALIETLDVDGDRMINAAELAAGFAAKKKKEKQLHELLFLLMVDKAPQNPPNELRPTTEAAPDQP